MQARVHGGNFVGKFKSVDKTFETEEFFCFFGVKKSPKGKMA
jgi:hypothetical protein